MSIETADTASYSDAYLQDQKPLAGENLDQMPDLYQQEVGNERAEETIRGEGASQEPGHHSYSDLYMADHNTSLENKPEPSNDTNNRAEKADVGPLENTYSDEYMRSPAPDNGSAAYLDIYHQEHSSDNTGELLPENQAAAPASYSDDYIQPEKA